MAQNNRLLALDILRGITIAGMLLVNNPGTWSHIYAPLDHAEWIGLTPTDLVFPFFMFCMGVAMFFSLKKFNFTLNGTLFVKIIRRTLLLFIIGWAVHWFSHVMYGMCRDGKAFSEVWNNLDSMRILGVFQRLALCYFFVSFIVVFCKHKLLPWLVAIILVAYAIILGVGHGYDFSTNNIIAQIDNAILGSNHMYHEGADGMNIAFDPEGILSTLPCIAHTLIGFLIGKMIVEHRKNEERMARLLKIGFTFILLGWLLTFGIPCSKKVWSSSYVLITTGLAMSVLALLIYVIDMKGHKKWCEFFHAFGVNPLTLYLLGSIFSIIFGAIVVCQSDDYVKGDAEKGVAMYTALAKQGCSQAQNNLAMRTYDDNQAEAVKWFQQAAADSANVNAKYNLAIAYMQDEDASNDAQIPVLLQTAADSANANAQFDLALCYDYGKFGASLDHAKAYDYYALAAKNGVSRAPACVELCLKDTVGITGHRVFDDMFITDMAANGTFEGDSLTAVQKSFNEASSTANGSGKRTSIKAAIYQGCQAVTVDDKMASCLYAILFIFFNWIFGFILFKKNIIIKL